MSPLQNVHADLNSELTWRCESIGKPRATYTWYKNSQPLQPVAGKLEIVANVMKINSLAESDMGMYQCGAHNVHGTTFSNAQLRVLCKLILLHVPITVKHRTFTRGNWQY